jgi:hypothetical protein
MTEEEFAKFKSDYQAASILHGKQRETQVDIVY